MLTSAYFLHVGLILYNSLYNLVSWPMMGNGLRDMRGSFSIQMCDNNICTADFLAEEPVHHVRRYIIPLVSLLIIVSGFE
jgi:hypothetical protein